MAMVDVAAYRLSPTGIVRRSGLRGPSDHCHQL